SHTASMAGDYAALEAICKSQNVTLMDDPMAMFLLALSMSRYPGKKIDNVTVVTTSGGGGALSAARLSEARLPMSEFSEQTRTRLTDYSAAGQAHKTIDLGGGRHDVLDSDAISEIPAATVLADDQVDVGLFVLTTAPSVFNTTDRLLVGAQTTQKPFLVVMLPGQAADSARQLLISQGIPFTNTLREAVDALSAWQSWSQYVEPDAITLPADLPEIGSYRGKMNEADSKQLLAAFGLPVNRDAFAGDIAAALTMSESVGFPLVAKVVSG